MRIKIVVAFAFLFLLGIWSAGLLPGHNDAAASPTPGTRQWAETQVLVYRPPAFAIDPFTLLAKDNTSSSCTATADGSFSCRVWLGTMTTQATVRGDGSVSYP